MTEIPLSNGETLLVGCTSAETALLVNDYPYGFHLRCKIRYWLEYRRGHGYRLCSQTTDARAPCRACAGRGQAFPADFSSGICSACAGAGAPWNCVRTSTYAPLAVLVRLPVNAKGIRAVTWRALRSVQSDESFEAFTGLYGAGLLDEQAQYVLRCYGKGGTCERTK